MAKEELYSVIIHARLEQLVKGKAGPGSLLEQVIAGYREVLNTIHENYEYIVPCPNIILQLQAAFFCILKVCRYGSIGG